VESEPLDEHLGPLGHAVAVVVVERADERRVEDEERLPVPDDAAGAVDVGREDGELVRAAVAVGVDAPDHATAVGLGVDGAVLVDADEERAVRRGGEAGRIADVGRLGEDRDRESRRRLDAGEQLLFVVERLGLLGEKNETDPQESIHAQYYRLRPLRRFRYPQAMRSSDNRAFKEWAVVCRALALGRQTLILRKGGIAEGPRGFEMTDQQFFLFPTYLHQSPASVIPEWQGALEECATDPTPGRVVISHYAIVASWLKISSLDKLRALEGLHIWSDEIVSERFHRWAEESVVAMMVRVYALRRPVVID